MHRRLVVLPAVLSALLLLPSTVWAGTLDQQQANPANDSFSLAGAFVPAQVFTAGFTGQLDQVDLQLFRFVESSGPGDDLTVEIWTVSAGVPASPVPGASATVLEADVPANTETWVTVPISAPSVAGTQYAIVLSAPDATGGCPFDDCWAWLADSSGPYVGGGSSFTVNGGATWTAQARDFGFRTYVAVVPQIAMSDAPDPVVAGTNLTYTIEVQNGSGVDWTDVLMQTGTPTGTTFVSFLAPAGWTTVTPPAGGTGTVSATRPTLTTGDGQQTFTLVVHVDASLTGGTILQHGAALGCCDGGGVVTSVETTVLAAPPAPAASALPDAAASPESASPWTALAFAVLLIGSLGAVALANLGVVRRRQ